MVLNSFCFCLSVKVLNLSLKFEQEFCWVEYSWLWVFHYFHHFKYIMALPSGLQSFCWKISWYLYGTSMYVICSFSLTAFNIVSLIFVILITVCLGVFFFGLILCGIICASQTWVTLSFPRLAKFLTIMSSDMFSGPFSLLFLGLI